MEFQPCEAAPECLPVLTASLCRPEMFQFEPLEGGLSCTISCRNWAENPGNWEVWALGSTTGKYVAPSGYTVKDKSVPDLGIVRTKA